MFREITVVLGVAVEYHGARVNPQGGGLVKGTEGRGLIPFVDWSFKLHKVNVKAMRRGYGQTIIQISRGLSDSLGTQFRLTVYLNAVMITNWV